MNNILKILRMNDLFFQIKDESIESVLKCLGAYQKKYSKNEIIFLEGSSISSIAVVISGSVIVTKSNIDGNNLVITDVTAGEMFGEALTCAGVKNSPFTVISKSDSDIMFIEISKILCQCSKCCEFHLTLIKNLVRIVARKNIYLNNRIDIISKRSLREKLLTYFEIEKKNFNRNDFAISFSREELASYLCVNRSAMSRELCSMRDAGLIDFNKNNFILKTSERRD